MRADAFAARCRHGPCVASPAPFAAPRRLDRCRAGRHRRDRSQALARRATRQGQAGIEPARPWQPLRGECCRIQHNGLLHAMPPVARKLASCRHCAQPPLCLAPLRACKTCLVRLRRKGHGQARCACSLGVSPRPPSIRPPEGAPWLRPPAAARQHRQGLPCGVSRRLDLPRTARAYEVPARQGPSRLRGAAKAAALTRSPPAHAHAREQPAAKRRMTLPAKNVPLAECFNASKENGNDEDDEGAVHA